MVEGGRAQVSGLALSRPHATTTWGTSALQGGKKPALRAAEQTGESPPLVREDAVNPVCRVTEAA